MMCLDVASDVVALHKVSSRWSLAATCDVTRSAEPHSLWYDVLCWCVVIERERAAERCPVWHRWPAAVSLPAVVVVPECSSLDLGWSDVTQWLSHSSAQKRIRNFWPGEWLSEPLLAAILFTNHWRYQNCHTDRGVVSRHFKLQRCCIKTFVSFLHLLSSATSQHYCCHFTGQLVLVKNWMILLKQSFTARMPLLKTTSAFGLTRRC